MTSTLDTSSLQRSSLKNYFDLIDWDVEPCTKPPLTIETDSETFMAAIAATLKLPKYPNNTQAVERMVRVVCEAATKRVRNIARDGLIQKLLESRTQSQSSPLKT